MYGERLALKSRLDELNHAEERIIRQFQEERERIYARLRKLDEEERFVSNSTLNEVEEVVSIDKPIHQEENAQKLVEQAKSELREEYSLLLQNLSTQLIEAKEVIATFTKKEKEQTDSAQPKAENKRSRRNKKKNEDFSKLYEEALTFLKHQTASVQSSDIKKEVESKTGVEITNMTNFMTRLMKLYPNIEKPYRGQYLYKENSASKNAEVVEVSEEEIRENTAVV